MNLLQEIEKRLEKPQNTEDIKEFIIIGPLDGECHGWAFPDHKCMIISLSETFDVICRGYKNTRSIMPSLYLFETWFTSELIAIQLHELLHIICPELKEHHIGLLIRKLVGADA